MELFSAARAALSLRDPQAKCAAAQELHDAWVQGLLDLDPAAPVEPIGEPGRPPRPRLVDPSRLPRRRPGSADGRAALGHAVAHIEFNAINLALDATYRFRGLPPEYYGDWLSVAADEARHFRMMDECLAAQGRRYGDFAAHDGLWEMARKTAHSCLVRMALVPRVLEARGLDVTPGMIERLEAVGDSDTAAALRVILAEEVRHVAIGTHWFRWCCAQEGREPRATFLQLLDRHYGGRPRGPFNLEARFEAGFTAAEMEALQEGTEAR